MFYPGPLRNSVIASESAAISFFPQDRTYLKNFSTNGRVQGVIPAQAGIHVFQGLKWTPACAGVTLIGDIIDFEIRDKRLK